MVNMIYNLQKDNVDLLVSNWKFYKSDTLFKGFEVKNPIKVVLKGNNLTEISDGYVVKDKNGDLLWYSSEEFCAEFEEV